MNDLNDLGLPELFDAIVAGAPDVARLLELAVAEDVQSPGDVTSLSIVDVEASGAAAVVAREAGVVAGLAVVPHLLAGAAPGCAFAPRRADGDPCSASEALGTLTGPRREVLRVERVLLNVLGRMCGVASLTRRFVDAVAGTGAAVCDTRKTLPGWRRLDKYAVRCGGGTLHRIGLSDAAMYKDNHLAGIPAADLGAALGRAIQRARALGPLRYVAVEVDRQEQLDAVLAMPAGLVDVILLDNFDPVGLREAVARRERTGAAVQLEASGGVTIDTARVIAATGVDRLSVGALTHSAPALDVALDIES
jgi:nicotinate-nucleotide pyrophosphorylase (carboxylating)